MNAEQINIVRRWLGQDMSLEAIVRELQMRRDIMNHFTIQCDERTWKYSSDKDNRLSTALALLKRFEFSWDDYMGNPGCGVCERHKWQGHAENCELAALIKEGDER